MKKKHQVTTDNKKLSILITLTLLTLILTISLVIGFKKNQIEKDENVYAIKVYGDVQTFGRIHGSERLDNQTVQIHYFTSNEDNLTVRITNVSKFTVVERGETILNNYIPEDNEFRIVINQEGIISFPVKSFSMSFELSSYNGTLESSFYRDDINISDIHGAGSLNMMENPNRFIKLIDGLLITDKTIINITSGQFYFDESPTSYIELEGTGDIYPYFIPTVNIDGEIVLKNCIEVNSRGRIIGKQDTIRFQGHDILVVTISEPEYIDHQGGYLEPWVVRIFNNSR